MKSIQIKNLDEGFYFRIRAAMARLQCKSYAEFLAKVVEMVEQAPTTFQETSLDERLTAADRLHGVVKTSLTIDEIKEKSELFLFEGIE